MQTRLWKYMRGGVRAAELYWTFVIRLSVKLQSSLKYVCKMNKEWNLVSFTQNTHTETVAVGPCQSCWCDTLLRVNEKIHIQKSIGGLTHIVLFGQSFKMFYFYFFYNSKHKASIYWLILYGAVLN